MSPSKRTPRVVSQAQTQIGGVKGRPDLEKGLKTPIEKVEAQLATVLEALKARDELKKAAVLATEAIRKAAFELRNSVRSNIRVIARRRGIYNPDLALLGGKPRANGRRSQSDAG